MGNEITTLEQAASAMNDRFIETSKTLINDVHKVIVEDVVNERLPEEVFVKYFLNFMMNPSKYTESDLLAKWIELAKGWYNEVDIINNDGEVLFTTPPISPVKHISSEKNSDINYVSIRGKFDNLKTLSTANANAYVHSKLSAIPDSVGTNTVANNVRWAAIFKRYTGIDDKISDSELDNSKTTDSKTRRKFNSSLLDIK